MTVVELVYCIFYAFNSWPTKCCLLITLANSLESDQARQFVGPDLDPNCLTP